MIPDFDSGIDGFGPERSRKARFDHHGSDHVEESSVEPFRNAVG